MMKDIYIFDSDLQLVGIVDAFKSLIWAKRYKETGDCELYVPATPENLVLCRKGYFILRDDDDMICQIKRVELDTDAENGNYIIATGYDAKRMLDQRIVWSTMTANGNAESFVRSMVDGALGSSAAEDRQMLDSTGRLIFETAHWGRRSTTTPRFPTSSRDEGLRLLHGLETNLATSLQTPQEA